MLETASGNYTNSMVESALYNMAIGYTEQETKEIYKGEKLAETIIITKEVAPDLNAIKLWLYNREPEKWKEKIVSNEDSLKKLDFLLHEIDTIINAED
jgi:hypothetical protein